MEPEKKYQIFVSSTYEDLKEERQEAITAIIKSGNMPIGMEYFPSANYAIFDYIKKMIDQADYYLLILGGKYGSIDPSTGKSFTQLEYEYAKSIDVPIIVFPRKDIDKNIAANKIEIDSTKRKLLNAFRKDAMQRMSSGMWDTPAELSAAILSALPTAIKDFPRVGWVRADQSDQLPDDFDYTQVAYVSHVDDMDFWEMNHDGETFTSKDVTWQKIVEKVFPHLQSMNTRYDVYSLVKSKCGEITDEDFDKVFLALQSMSLIASEKITFPEGGGDMYFHLTRKGTAALLKCHKIG